MRQNKSWFRMSGILAVLAVALMLPASAGAASKYKSLYKFTGGADGRTPAAGLIFDTAGNLYSTTDVGGTSTNCSGSGCGTVFKLVPNSDGSWTESVLYSFTGGADGAQPFAGLIFDTTGNLYGTTIAGGNLTCNMPYGCGVVFKLAPNSEGSWTESVLYSFTGGADGAQPFAGLLFDTAEKNLYGTTRFGGDTTDCLSFGGCGTVFSLTQNSDGSWTEHVLHRFHHSTKDGKNPFGGLIFDTAGNLYGTTPNGGAHGGGTVFELKPGANGTWAASVLYSFCSLKSCADGFIPVGSLTFDGTGNLYGATAGGGGSCSAGCGVVFQLKPNADGSWTESVLHRFAHNPDATPDAGLIFDSAGNLYGTTIFGGVCSDDGAGCGTVFKLAPLSGGGWTHSVLHVFNGNPAMYPVANVFLDKAGNLYGTTEECGRGYNCFGVVFEITP